jgi:hypothetical protein
MAHRLKTYTWICIATLVFVVPIVSWWLQSIVISTLIYILIKSLPSRLQVIALACSIVFASIPWTGIVGACLHFPGRSDCLPAIDVEDAYYIGPALRFVAEILWPICVLPCAVVGYSSSTLYQLCFYPEGPHIGPFGPVRPVMVSIIWTYLAVLTLTAYSFRIPPSSSTT